MNKIEKLTNLGGFPMTQYTLEFMQQSYRDALAALSRLVGNSVIVSGMEETGSTVADGWISYNGELLPFIGGARQSTWIVEEVAEGRLFADQVTRDVYVTRRARFASGGVPYTNLQRIDTLLAQKSTIANLQAALNQRIDSIWKRGDVIEIDVDASYISANFDGSGLGRNERAGWAICNGNNGTRNRNGRFPVGYDPNRWPYNVMGNTGGQETVTLSVSEMPSHSHTFYGWGDYKVDNVGTGGTVTTNYDRSGTLDARMNSVGGSQPHENRPPFIVTLFIMKL